MKTIFKKLIISFTVAFVACVSLAGMVNTAHAANIDYRKPSENKPYPDVQKNPNMWIHVNLKKQRVYLMSDHNKTLYTMYCSSGAIMPLLLAPTISRTFVVIPSIINPKRPALTIMLPGKDLISYFTQFQSMIRANMIRNKLRN